MDRSSSQPSESLGAAKRPELTEVQEAAVLHAAERRVVAAVRREASPSTRAWLGDVADVSVYGVFVTLKRAGRLRACCGCLGADMLLAEALDMAADRAATDDPRFAPISPYELNRLDIDVWILWGPQRVAAQGEDRVKAVVIGKHGVQIARGGARGLLLPGVAVDYGFDARTFLEQVCLKAGLPTDAWKDNDAVLQVFEGLEICGHMTADEPDARPPAVAGSFYPGQPIEVDRMVDEMLAEIEPAAPQAWSGVLVPHAGWVYSGHLAAMTLRRIQFPECAIILCPHHRPDGANWAVAPHRQWLIPGGSVNSDTQLAVQLAEGITGLKLDAAAHAEEHAVEIQLPILARLAPWLRIVGIAIGGGNLTELLRFGREMADVLRDMPRRPLLIISSDMNHFAEDAETRRVDRLALDAIATLDPTQVYETVHRHHISMCGVGPCVIVMEALKQLGCLTRSELVGYATSADAGGPTDRVVGYAGVLFG
jgi:AmmeMemoRadiSam system protein B/AmmeMemoRadiSam system protein A